MVRLSVRPILQEAEELREELAAATVELSIPHEEINSMKSKMNELLKDRDSFINFGQVVEHVGVGQQRRKISHFSLLSPLDSFPRRSQFTPPTPRTS